MSKFLAIAYNAMITPITKSIFNIKNNSII